MQKNNTYESLNRNDTFHHSESPDVLQHLSYIFWKWCHHSNHNDENTPDNIK